MLASRLATNCDAHEALVERGDADTNRQLHNPATFFNVLQSRDADTITLEPDPSLGDKPFPGPQGRGLGGGTWVNGMIYMRVADRCADAILSDD